jgi:hypothetical protein
LQHLFWSYRSLVQSSNCPIPDEKGESPQPTSLLCFCDWNLPI